MKKFESISLVPLVVVSLALAFHFRNKSNSFEKKYEKLESELSYSAQQITEKVRKATVRLKDSNRGTGSGFFVAPDTKSN